MMQVDHRKCDNEQKACNMVCSVGSKTSELKDSVNDDEKNTCLKATSSCSASPSSAFKKT